MKLINAEKFISNIENIMGVIQKCRLLHINYVMFFQNVNQTMMLIE